MIKHTITKALILPIAFLAFGATAQAEESLTKTTPPIKAELREGAQGDDQRTVPIITGTVTAINGSTITMTSKVKNSTVSTIYTVDASSARIQKNKETGTIASIVVGDTIAVNGTIADSKIAAKIIIAGTTPAGIPKPKAQKEKEQKKIERENDDAPADIKAFMDSMGDGQPIIAGTITAISGSTITITNKSNVTYTVNAANAAITRGTTKKAAVSTLAVGDALVAQGAINDNTVTATMIISKPTPANTAVGVKVGLFGKIGNFFGRIFGF